MRAWWVPLLLVPMLAGCLTVFDDPGAGRDVAPSDRPGMDAVRVSSVRTSTFEVGSFDGTPISTIVHEPLTTDALPDGSRPAWPALVFLHGFGNTKENWQRIQMGHAEPVDLLDRFAREGFLVVAYDARGFGQSGGQSTIAGPAEAGDLEAVLDHVLERFPTNGDVGLTGYSYGAGQSLIGLARDDRVVTAVPLYGWVDLADGLMPGHVPKIGWMHFLGAYGAAASGGALHPDIVAWYEAAYLRAQDPDAAHQAEEAIRGRGVGDRLAVTDKPLLVCQGMQESLFPQVDRAMQAGGFTRAYVHPGGHGGHDAGCWDRALDWFRFFLQGIDTQVDRWPVLETVDARDNGQVVAYASTPSTTGLAFGLRQPDLTQASYSNDTFTVAQRLIGNPLATPAGVSDVLGTPPQQVPDRFTEDPQAVFFRSAPFDEGQVLLGAPTLSLALADEVVPFQVAATLYIESDGMRAPISHGAAAVLTADHIENGTVTLAFPWTKADIEVGERLVLEVAANDPGFWLPLLENYSVDFTGESRLTVPVFEP